MFWSWFPFPCFWMISGTPAATRKHLKTIAEEASSYEEWYDAQEQIDQINGVDLWANDDKSIAAYDPKRLRQLYDILYERRELDKVGGLSDRLRLARRGVFGILEPALYRRSFIKTKQMIHDFIAEIRAGLQRVASHSPANHAKQELSDQEKLDFFQAMSRIVGRTTLVLQNGGGACACHIGVVRALFKQNLLPNIITGTGMGALVAAVVATSRDHELLDKMNGSAVNLSAFIQSEPRIKESVFDVWRRRFDRYRSLGYVFDMDVIEQCAWDNIGDMTFAEAFEYSGRVLNITVPMPLLPGQPQLLNHITASQVLIWSAVSISIASSQSVFEPRKLYMKDELGRTVTYTAPDYILPKTFRGASRSPAFPLGRLGEMFNVNNFLVSQTQPYLAPLEYFYQWAYHRSTFFGGCFRASQKGAAALLKIVGFLGYRPDWLYRAFRDEMTFSSLQRPKVIIPAPLTWQQWLSICDIPDPSTIDHLADIGEKSVWPYICQIKIRCEVEKEVELNYLARGGGRYDW